VFAAIRERRTGYLRGAACALAAMLGAQHEASAQSGTDIERRIDGLRHAAERARSYAQAPASSVEQQILSGPEITQAQVQRAPGDPELRKDLEFAEFTTENCSATKTVTLNVRIDQQGQGGTFETLNGSLAYEPVPIRGGSQTIKADSRNGVVTTNGAQRLQFVMDNGERPEWATGFRIKPRLDLATDDETVSPMLVGTFKLHYRERPDLINVWPSITLEIPKARMRGATPSEILVELQSYIRGEAVHIRDENARPLWARVDEVESVRIGETDLSVRVTLTEWANVA